MAVTISVVLPAYNEAHRIVPCLAAARVYLEQQYRDRHEVIVVDDGSCDGLADTIQPLLDRWPQLQLLRHEVNRGKGAAVRSGMLAASGQQLLFADADGAAPIDQEQRLAAAIAAGADVAVGSRLVAAPDVRRRRPWRRRVAGRVFAAVARRWFALPVLDTQCGFKMFRRQPGRRLFSASQETGYLFDLEVLALAHRWGYWIAEVPISWTDVPGGHFSLLAESFRVPLALWRLRRRLASYRCHQS